MPQDAFTLKHVISELDAMLTGGKISRINQPSKDDLTFLIYTKNTTVKLEICAHAQNCRLNIGLSEKQNPQPAPNFCMLLRKHLQNAQIKKIHQIGFERIAAIDFLCANEFESAERILYCEIMGKYSNVILTENGKILGALKTSGIDDGTHRLLLAGAQYRLPPPQDKVNPLEIENLRELFTNRDGDLAKFISDRVLGICYSTALDIENTLGSDASADGVYGYITDDNVTPCVTYADGKPSDFKAKSKSRDKKPYPTLLEAQSAYYAYVNKKKRFEDKKRRMDSALKSAEKKCAKRLAIIHSKRSDCGDMEDIKLKGELITANIYAIERGMASFEAVNYYDENCSKITIPLDRQLSPSENAQRYYKKYAKLKRTAAALDIQQREADREKEYLASIRCHIDAADDEKDFDGIETELAAAGLIKLPEDKRKKKKTDEKPVYRQFIYNGYKIIAGRNNLQNERLTKSLAESDVWLHTQKYHSSHVAVLSEGRSVPEDVIKIAAEICAYYSEARQSGKVPVDYALKKYVKKPSASKAGFVTYTEYKTAIASPDAHADLRNDSNE
ncbi:MAG: NFACT family protein [Clostridia bacterium]|nr:NFACT family protein [Clostridia bacterium]